MTQTAPFEIVAAPYTVYFAATGTSFPEVDDTAVTGFTKIGTAGDRNYSEDGVVVVHEQTIELFRMLGGTGPRKAVRTEEGLMVRFTLHDLTPEEYNAGLNNNAETTVAAASGTPGHKDIKLYQDIDVVLMALLVRGNVSTEGAGWLTQYQIPVCFQSASPEVTFAKGAPAGLALEFTALEDPDAATPNARFGKLVTQHATQLA